MNTEEIIKSDLAAMIPKAKSHQVAKYTRIQNFTLKGDEESCHVYYYSYDYLPDILNPDETIKFSSYPEKLKIITKLK